LWDGIKTIKGEEFLNISHEFSLIFFEYYNLLIEEEDSMQEIQKKS
jgi:hypothetical protein